MCFLKPRAEGVQLGDVYFMPALRQEDSMWLLEMRLKVVLRPLGRSVSFIHTWGRTITGEAAYGYAWGGTMSCVSRNCDSKLSQGQRGQHVSRNYDSKSSRGQLGYIVSVS